jgi:RNA polymerase sigma factor (sigma-70 family)
VLTPEEADVIERCRAGDERAYRQLVTRYNRQVFALAMRMVRQAEDAEDLTQETFVRMFRALDRYDINRPFEAWLFTIASRVCIDHLRRRRIKPISLHQADPSTGEERLIEPEDPGLKPDELASHAEEEARAQELIDTLPPHYKIVVVLRHQHQQSYEEIAEALKLPLGTVKARIHRARALLKQRIERDAP